MENLVENLQSGVLTIKLVKLSLSNLLKCEELNLAKFYSRLLGVYIQPFEDDLEITILFF